MADSEESPAPEGTPLSDGPVVSVTESEGLVVPGLPPVAPVIPESSVSPGVPGLVGPPGQTSENQLASIGLTPNDLVNIFVVEATNLMAEPLMNVPIPDPDPLDENGPPLPLPVKFPDEDLEITIQDESTTFDSTCSRSISELESFKKKLIEDERLSQIYKLRYNFSERFDNRQFLHPHGTTNFDYKAIKESRKAGFEKFKNKIRQENYLYLGHHPEIRALISMFLKKLLTTLPADPAQYMAEYFATQMRDTDFPLVVEQEVKKISRYRVNRMLAQGRVKIRPSTVVRHEEAEEEDVDEVPPEVDINLMKKLNIGPLAQDFYFDARFMPKKKEPKVTEKPKKKKKKKHVYCGCKDFKVKGRKKPAVTSGQTVPEEKGKPSEEEMTTEGEDTGEEEGDEEEEGREMPQTLEDAERMASEIVNALVTG